MQAVVIVIILDIKDIENGATFAAVVLADAVRSRGNKLNHRPPIPGETRCDFCCPGVQYSPASMVPEFHHLGLE